MIRRLPHIISILLLFSLFFLWGTKGNPWLFFTAFWPQAHLLYGGALVVLLLLTRFLPGTGASLFERFVVARYLILPPLAGIATILITFLVFQGIPHVIDAAHFRWSARLLQEGALTLPAGDLYEYQDATFMVRDDGWRYSLFLPGFSVFLALFDLVRLDWLLVPLCTALSVYLTGRIADRFFDAETSLLAMLLTTVSSFFLFMGASFMTHNFNLFLVMLAAWLVVKDPKNIKGLVLASVALAVTFFVRPQNAVFAYLPLGSYLLVKRVGLRPLIAFVLPAVIGAGGLLLFNQIMTGHPTVFPQDVYFSVIEPTPFCHRLGLGTGCPNTEGEYLPPEGLTLDYAFWVAYTRLTLMLFNVAGHPYPFLFLLVACWFALRKSLLLLSFFFTFFAGYFFFYLPGNLFGPRYFTEVTMLVMIPAAYGIVALTRTVPRYARPFIAAFPTAGVLFVSLFIMPELSERYQDRFWVTDRSFEQAIEREGIAHSVVFVPAPYHAMLLNTQTRPPFDDHGNLIVKDLGRENLYGAAWFMEKHGLKNAYVIDYYPKLRNLVVVEELPEFRRDDIWIEVEHKGRPFSGRPAYATPVAAGVKLKNLPFVLLDEHLDFGNDQGYAILFGALTDRSYYDIAHPILFPGPYEMLVEYLTLPCSGSFRIAVNGREVGSFSGNGKGQRFESITIPVNLTEGRNVFSFIPESGQSCLVLDYLRLRHRDSSLRPGSYPDYAAPEEKELNKP